MRLDWVRFHKTVLSFTDSQQSPKTTFKTKFHRILNDHWYFAIFARMSLFARKRKSPRRMRRTRHLKATVFVRSSRNSLTLANVTRWLYCVEWHNAVFDSKRSPICAQAVYFLGSTMPSVTCWLISALSAVLLIFSFQFSLLFFHIGRQTERRRIGLRNMGRRTLPKIWIGTFLVRNVHPRNNFE